MKPVAAFVPAGYLLLASECVGIIATQVIREPRGWRGNPNNPHRPATTDPGHINHHGKGNPGHR